MKRIKQYLIIILLGSSVVCLLGCSVVKEGVKGIAGISTKILDDTRSEAVSKTFNCECNLCYEQVKEILGRIGVYVYAQDPKKHMIAVYVSREDTTPVGIFLSEIDKNNTKIEVSSPSTFAKELVSKKVFLFLEKSLNPQEEEKKEGKDTVEQ